MNNCKTNSHTQTYKHKG